MDYLEKLFSSEGFMPHGHCYLWTPELLWLNIAADSIIALAYMSIPVTLIYFIRKRKDLPFNWMFGAFGIFILACGATHLMDIWTIWNPAYWLAGSIKAVTAMASIVTAVLLVKLVPTALRIPSQEQLTSLNNELTIANAELQQANRRLEEANHAKRDFLANMSHELRTPLNAVLGYAQLLKREPGMNERQAHGLNTIEQSGQHLLSLISDLLDLTKIEAGKLELHPDTLHLATFLAIVGDIIRVRAEEKGLSFVQVPAPELPVVMADAQRLRQILLNLLGNAVKFTDHGQVSLRVGILPTAGHTARLRFEVQDSGVGIAPEQQGIIFQPFEQVGDTQRRAGGTGLGLSISRRLVHLMGGEIQVDSRPGGGSRFWFDLEWPIAAEDLALAAPSAVSINGYRGPRRSVLVVDDTDPNRSLLVDLLRPLGFAVSEASNGQEALQQAQAAAPDLVLTDLAMPVMGGVELIRQLRRTPGLESLPIIVVSASASDQDRADSRIAGANAFLLKPIEHSDLLREIGLVLGLVWITDESVAKVSSSPDSAPLVAPTRDEMKILHQLALSGNMRAIRERATYLAGLDAQYRGFAGKIEHLAKTYQSVALLGFVEEHLSEGVAS
ncbi:MAG: ATP-binding protein [Rhodocyclaceae bacterium]